MLGAWLSAQRDFDLHVATITIAEVWRGILSAPAGAKRRALEAWFSGSREPTTLFAGRILAFDQPAPMQWAQLMAEGARAGRPRSPLDMIVAATAVANDCLVVTANGRHFRGVVALVNPTRDPPAPG